ncbi:MAG: hypothetical protein AAGG48_18475 [Planctomycetota bacterium]
MTNPYQAPETASDKLSERRRSLWRWPVAILIMVLATPIVLYGAFICVMVARSDFLTPPIPTWVILSCGILIITLGIGFAMLGVAVVRSSGRVFLYGLMAMILSVVAYIGIVVRFA